MKYIKGVLALTLIVSAIKAQESQQVELSKLSPGNFTVYKVTENGNNFKFEIASRQWPLSFTKEGESITELVVSRAGIIEEKYQADLPGYPAYYKSETSEIVVSAIDKKIYYYTWSVKTGSSIKYIFSESKPKNYSDEKGTLDSYRNNIKELQSTTRTQRMEQNNAIAEKQAEENTLKGKAIKSVNIIAINKPSEMGLLSIVALGVEFVLDNGKILKTKNLGGFTPYTDFETEVSGGEFAGGDFKVADDSRKVSGDKIEISVWSKFDEKKIKGRFSYPLNYKKDIFYNYQGASGANGRGYTSGYTVNGSNGSDGKNLSIAATTMPLNGEQINKLVITDTYSGKILSESKVHVDNTITINANGGSGGNGSEGGGNGGSGGNGGNGGNIVLSGNGATALKMSFSALGGQGGVGGKAKNQTYLRGPNGSQGKNGILSK